MIFPGRGVENAGRADVFIGDVNPRSIGAQTKFVQDRNRRESCAEISFARRPRCDAIGGFVGLGVVIIVIMAFFKNRIAIGVQFGRWLNWRAAQCDINCFSIRTGVDAARTLARREWSQ